MAKQASRLIVVSARAPFVREGPTIARAPGGLVSALLPLMQRAGGTWIAAGNERDADALHDAEFQVVPVSIPNDLRRVWYADAANGALWPLAHGFIERCRFHRHAEHAYREVNQRVANVVVARTPLRGTVWIHDYQLALVPELVRAQRPDLALGFYWHIPWPAAEFVLALPWRRELVTGLLGAHVIGLQIQRYVRAFEMALRDLGFVFERDGTDLVVQADGHVCRVVTCPVGVDVDQWSALGRRADVQKSALDLRDQLTGSRLLLAVDRVDYAKGIIERLEAFEQLLERSREARESATLVQIAVPSRETVKAYRDLRERIEATIGRIMGRFGSPNRRPVHLFARGHNAKELAAFYLAADVAVVTPLRDGLNLVAFEYVATRPAPTGRLLLSETTGAADVLRSAWLVNPYDKDALDDALEAAALSGETNDDALRMTTLQQVVTNLSVDHWTSNFLQHLHPATNGTTRDKKKSKICPKFWLSAAPNLEEITSMDKAEPRRRGA